MWVIYSHNQDTQGLVGRQIEKKLNRFCTLHNVTQHTLLVAPMCLNQITNNSLLSACTILCVYFRLKWFNFWYFHDENTDVNCQTITLLDYLLMTSKTPVTCKQTVLLQLASFWDLQNIESCSFIHEGRGVILERVALELLRWCQSPFCNCLAAIGTYFGPQLQNGG